MSLSSTSSEVTSEKEIDVDILPVCNSVAVWYDRTGETGNTQPLWSWLPVNKRAKFAVLLMGLAAP